jgi:hypothetical protein
MSAADAPRTALSLVLEAFPYRTLIIWGGES